MGGGVGHVEGAAEGVAELVVQGHGGGPEAGAAQPRAVLGTGAGVEVGAVGDEVRERGGQCPDASSAIRSMTGEASGA